MSAVLDSKPHTAEEYLAIDRAASFRSEFHDGPIYAMTGASREHNLGGVQYYRRTANPAQGPALRSLCQRHIERLGCTLALSEVYDKVAMGNNHEQ